MDRQNVLKAKVNLFISAAFILSFGIFVLTIGFKLTHMHNPISSALSPQAEDLLDN